MVTKTTAKPSTNPKAEAKPEAGQTKTRARAKTSQTKAKTGRPKATEAKTTEAKAAETKATKAKATQAKAADSPEPQKQPKTDFSLSTTQASLGELLATVESAVPSKPSSPVLGYLKIEVKSGACSVTASDQHQSITASATCHTLCEGVGLIPTQLISVVKASQSGDSLTLSGTTTNDSSEISLSTPNGVISTTPLAMTAEQFPETLISPDVSWHNVSAQKLRLGLQTVLGSAAPKDLGSLKSVHFIFTEEAVTCEATDGHRVAVAAIDTTLPGRAKRKSAEPEPEQVDCIVPLDAVRSLIKILSQAQADSEVSIRLHDRKALFQVSTESSQVELVCQCIGERYPNIPGLLAQFKYDKSAIISQANFLQRLHVLAAISDNETTGVELLLKGSIIQASRNGKQLQGTQTVEATIGMEPDEFRILMNLPLLIDLVKVLKGELLIEFNGPQNLVKLTPTAAPELQGIALSCYLMPLERAKADKGKSN